jgi:putative Ca2+/H+ antiporter (TMEM165/GDT1 family)
LLGIFIGTALIHFMSAIIGDKVSALIPTHYLKILIGHSFIGFGIWTLKGDICGEKEKNGSN